MSGKSIELSAHFDLDELAGDIVHNFGMSSTLTADDIVDFFLRIDNYIGDWDFTKKVIKVFADELMKMES